MREHTMNEYATGHRSHLMLSLAIIGRSKVGTCVERLAFNGRRIDWQRQTSAAGRTGGLSVEVRNRTLGLASSHNAPLFRSWARRSDSSAGLASHGLYQLQRGKQESSYSWRSGTEKKMCSIAIVALEG